MLDLITSAIRAFYILSTIAILTARLVPSSRDRFLAYGPRDPPAHGAEYNVGKKAPVGIQLLDYVAILKVPHSWFSHFYMVSVISSIGCLVAFQTGIYVKSHAASRLCCILMLIQGSRRLIECLFLTKPSESRMWIGHYAIGLAFYIVTNVAIWIEDATQDEFMQIVAERRMSLGGASTLRTVICCSLFLYSSYTQHTYHHYLTHLKKYTLPDGTAFQWITAPHYTAECGIYLALALLDVTRPLQTVNCTLLCTLMFVMVNLGVTADGTRTWMMQKFPEHRDRIERRWRMIPFVW